MQLGPESTMSVTQIELIRFIRPDSSEHSLFVSNLSLTLAREEKWAQLSRAFSRFGLHQVQLPKENLSYGFVKYYSPYSAQCALKALNRQVVVGGSTVRVQRGRDKVPFRTDNLYINDCYELANHYLGFNGWNIHVQTLGPSSDDSEYECAAILHIKGWGVESVGRGRVPRDLDEGLDIISKIKSLGALKKQVFNRACEDAFSRIVLGIVQPGQQLASVTVITSGCDEHEHVICPTVNVLADEAYDEYSQTEGGQLLTGHTTRENNSN